MKVFPIYKVGGSLTKRIEISYDKIVQVLGFKPNATHLDDPDKVKASWGFRDENGRKGFIWCYKHPDPINCDVWSTDGDMDLIDELFPAETRYEREMREWESREHESEMAKAMTKPNKPGYFWANND